MQRAVATPEETKLNITALSIAQGFTRALAMEYGYLFSSSELELSRHLCNSVIQAGVPQEYKELLASSYPTQRLFCNKNFIPAYDQTTMLRKLMIKSKIAAAIKNGVEQIVILGGGYDIRGFITAKINNVSVFELDRGQTRAKKIAGIKSIPSSFGFNNVTGTTHFDGTVNIDDKLFFVDCDFIKDNLVEKLQAHGYSTSKKTIIIAEGLTAYLSFEDNVKLLKSISAITTESDELVIGYIDKGVKTAALDKALTAAKEEHKLSLEPHDIVTFASESGFAVTQQFYPTHLLSKIGDRDDDNIYQANEKIIKEYYVAMVKGKPEYQNIHAVPFYEFEIPVRNNKVALDYVAKVQP